MRWVAVGLLVSAVHLGAADVKLAPKELPKDVPAALREAIGANSIEIADNGKPVLDIWPTKSVKGKTLETIPQAALLGIVNVPAARRDYRDDALPAGVYTMRFALQPQDGNHLGTADYIFFGVLTPIKRDQKPDAITDYKALVKSSSADTSTDHPLILSLRPPSGTPGKEPKIVEPASDHKAVLTALTSDAGAIPVEIVFEGKANK